MDSGTAPVYPGESPGWSQSGHGACDQEGPGGTERCYGLSARGTL